MRRVFNAKFYYNDVIFYCQVKCRSGTDVGNDWLPVCAGDLRADTIAESYLFAVVLFVSDKDLD